MVASIATLNGGTLTTGSNGSSNSNSNNRIIEVLYSIPPTTVLIVCICSIIYIVLEMIFEIPPIYTITFFPYKILYQYELYRIFTHIFFHSNNNILHILMNMISLIQIGTIIEESTILFGSIRFLYTICIVSPITIACINLLIAILAQYIFHYPTLMIEQSIGISGVLFHMLVIQCNILSSIDHPRNLFGSITVPSYLYPWILLFILQIMIPNVSFMGHLSGILAGTIQVYYKQSFHYYLYPSEQYFIQFDTFCSRYIPYYTTHPKFVPTTSISSVLFTSGSSNNNSNNYNRNGINIITTTISRLCSSIKDVRQRIWIRNNSISSVGNDDTVLTNDDNLPNEKSETISLLV